MKVKNYNNLLVFSFSIIYLLSLFYFFIFENYLLLILPFLLGLVLSSISNFKSILLPLFFFTPLSIPLSELNSFNLDFEMALPTEPILFGLMLLTIFNILYRWQLFKPIFHHPITYAVLIYLIWIFISSVTSTMPFVSFKFLISKLWYILPLFFMGALLFKQKKYMSYFIILYSVPLVCVIIYTIIRHSGYSFDKQSAHYMMSPFFKDHTSYGAIIAFFLPLTITLFTFKKNNPIVRILLFIVIFFLLLGFVLSFSRAAWLSLFISLIIALILKLKINRRLLFSTPFFLLGMLFFFQSHILRSLEKNTQDTSDNIIEHTTSISNISTDASNVERINRWNCAISMFYEKPVFGWGPGTYQFQYAPFQLLKHNTVIRSRTGDMGNAHSEYLGPLCETGFIGFISFIVLVLVIMMHAVNQYYTTHDKYQATWILAIIVSLSSYFIHGFFNNFLDTDKASVPVWTAIAILVSFDLLNNKSKFS